MEVWVWLSLVHFKGRGRKFDFRTYLDMKLFKSVPDLTPLPGSCQPFQGNESHNVDATCWFGFPEGVVGDGIYHFSSGRWRFEDQFVYFGCVFPSIDLCHPPDTYEPVRVAFEHEFLERAHLLQVAFLCCSKDTLSQVTNSPMGIAPINGIPVGLLLGSVC